MLNILLKTVRQTFCLVIVLFTTSASAQIDLVKKLTENILGYNNLTYRSINKLKDMSADTTVALNAESFLKAPDDKLFGYLYSIETNHQTEDFHRTDLYNGKEVTILSVQDSTFFVEKEPYIAYSKSLIGGLKFLQDRYLQKPYKIEVLADTLIGGKDNLHYVAEIYNAVVNNQHLYSYRHYYVDKTTSLPTMVTIIGKYEYNGLINNYYSETRYSNYKFNQPGTTAASFTVPSEFKPRKDQAPVALLPKGTIAPDWILAGVNGKPVSLNQLKGKVVLLDFYFIGCSGCMSAIKPLNKIYQKYKKKDVVIASLTHRDSKTAVLDFDKRYGIAYPGYINAAGVVQSYHVTSFPTFYFIDKEGKIRYSFIGYEDDFENKVTAMIDNLLK